MSNLDAPVARPGSERNPTGQPAEQVGFAVKLAIIGYALAYIALAMYLVVDAWVLDQAFLKRLLGLSISATLPPLFISAFHAVLGAILGAGALDIVSFHHYVAIKQDFQSPHVWGYFVGPWLAAALGLMVFALMQSGLLVFTGGTAPAADATVSNLGYLAIGFLSGFGWFQATERIRDIVTRFFAPASKEPASAVPAHNAASADLPNPDGKADALPRD